MTRPRIRWAVLALLPVVGLVLGGCGGKSGPPTGDVFGTVTCEGTPVAEGTVSFMNAKVGTGGEGALKNGAYRLSAPLPTGEYVVTVLPLVVQQQEGGKGPPVGLEKPAPDIPRKYRNDSTTDLKRTVTEGPNQIDFDLKKR